MTDQKKTLAEENSELVDVIFRLINYMNNDTALTKALIERLSREHRTLQQNFIRMLKKVIEAHADTHTDDRNAASVKWAKKVREIGKDDFMPFI